MLYPLGNSLYPNWGRNLSLHSLPITLVSCWYLHLLASSLMVLLTASAAAYFSAIGLRNTRPAAKHARASMAFSGVFAALRGIFFALRPATLDEVSIGTFLLRLFGSLSLCAQLTAIILFHTSLVKIDPVYFCKTYRRVLYLSAPTAVLLTVASIAGSFLPSLIPPVSLVFTGWTCILAVSLFITILHHPRYSNTPEHLSNSSSISLSPKQSGAPASLMTKTLTRSTICPSTNANDDFYQPEDATWPQIRINEAEIVVEVPDDSPRSSNHHHEASCSVHSPLHNQIGYSADNSCDHQENGLVEKSDDAIDKSPKHRFPLFLPPMKGLHQHRRQYILLSRIFPHCHLIGILCVLLGSMHVYSAMGVYQLHHKPEEVNLLRWLIYQSIFRILEFGLPGGIIMACKVIIRGYQPVKTISSRARSSRHEDTNEQAHTYDNL